MRAALLAFILLLAPGAARADPWRATYTISAAGLPIFDAEVRFKLDGPRYFVETRVHARGLARLVMTGEQVSRSEGIWAGADPRPAQHQSTGSWRGSPRATRIHYLPDGTPRVLELLPAEDMPRSPVPAEAQRGAVDTLSAMAALVRQVGEAARCETRARSFDGRRLTALEAMPAPAPAPRPDLRCVIETRTLAGYALDRDPAEAQAPFRVTVLFGHLEPQAPVLPLRIELPSRWWGRIEIRLTGLARP
jgi:hypothetical protein